MKRKLKLHRETLRNLEVHEIQKAEGGGGSGYVTCIPSLVQTECTSCPITCVNTCQFSCPC